MDLPAGVYTVTEVLRHGWQQTWPPAGYYSFLLDPSQTIDGLNFGNRPEPVGGIHGNKWLDENGNGQRDPNEPGLAGWTIRLVGSNGVMSTTVTDEFGRYWFMGLPAGVYTITEVLQSDWQQTWPPAGYYSFLLDPNQIIDGLNFGNRPEPVGGIHGAKWLDENGNGQWDPNEPGLPGWTIRLEGSDGTTLSTVTGENGRYWFMDLKAGTYTVTELLQPGWQQTWPPAGYYSFLLDPSQTVDGLNFGNRPEPEGGIHGIKWLDENGNGQRDPNEPGLAGWTILLEGSDGLMLSAVTDEFGRYWFMDLPGGVYTISEVLQPGWQQTWPTAGYHTVTLHLGQTIEELDFGNRKEPVGGIHGVKWLDENGNGQRDPNEPGLAGWNIRLEGEDGTTLSTVTGEGGRYWFMDLPAGVYTVTEFLQSGWEQTWPLAGHYTITLQLGESIENLDFGNREEPVGGIHGVKWLDENGNGQRDSNEPGLPGWTIRLKGEGGTTLSTVTGEGGHYWFMDLSAGVYTVTEILQPGWEQTFPGSGVHIVALASGQIVEGLDFGNTIDMNNLVYLPVMIRGR